MRKINKFLFDFDGTLVDSMPTYGSVMLRILDENNITYPKDILKIITPLGYLGTARYYIENFGLTLSEDDIIAHMREYMYAEYANNVCAKDNVIETLKILKADGADLNVLTASPHLTLDACLKRLGIFDVFTNVWSCEDFSTTKSDPEIYKLACKKLSANVNEVLFLDDNYNADKTAKKAGLKVCGVYDPSSAEYVEEIKSITDFYIYDFKELLNIR